MAIRLLTIDLDGTLAIDLDHIPWRTQQTIEAAMAQGVLVSLATGREYASAAKVAQKLSLNSPIICYQGNIVRDHRTGNLISATSVPFDVGRQVIKFARQHKYPLVLFMLDGNYTELPTPLMHDTVQAGGTNVKTVNNLLTLLDEPARLLKFLLVMPATQMAETLQTVSQCFGEQLTVLCSGEFYVEAFWPTASKGAALALLATQNQVPLADTMAIGDHDNDISMLEKAGLSVAMGNGSAGAKAAAEVIAPTVGEEGVAWAIETYILDKTYDRDS